MIVFEIYRIVVFLTEKIRWFVELPIACGALLKARSWRFGLSFLFLQKSQ